MSDATAKATVKVRLIGKAQSGEAFVLRDFLQRSVVAFDWIELGRDQRIDRELALSEDEAQRLPIVQLPDGVRLYAPSVRQLAEHLGWVTQPRLKEYDVSIYGAGPVPVVNPIGLTSEAESRILLSYEGSLQPCLVGAGRVVPVTSFVGRRDLGPPASD